VNKKTEQLGCNLGSAAIKLRKLILFDLIVKFDLNKCYRCGKSINAVGDFTLDHKIDWLDSVNPKELFFDVSNVTFSHALCNRLARRTPNKVRSKVGFKGVYFNSARKKPYKAELETKINGEKKVYRLGRFETAEEAALVYDAKAKEILGNRAISNHDMGLI
jgi:hypothetical protein